MIRCSLPGDDPDALVEEVMARTGLTPEENGQDADLPAEQIAAYLAGELTGFEVEIDWRLIPGFRRRALIATRRVPYGETASYGEVAIMAGSPGAARAVGTAMSQNPISVIIPCHRVIRADGSIGGYGSGRNGVRLKQRLLDLERTGVATDQGPAGGRAEWGWMG